MTFIEVHTGEDVPALRKIIKGAYAETYRQKLPTVRFGRVILWSGRMFQELKLPKQNAPDLSSYEDKLLRCWKLPENRARMQLGSMRGEVFTTPPETGDELSARIREGGRCGREYVVRAFQYCDFHREH